MGWSGESNMLALPSNGFLDVFDLFIQFVGDYLELGGASALYMIQLVAVQQVSATRDIVVALSTYK